MAETAGRLAGRGRPVARGGRWLALSLAAFALIATWLFGATVLVDRQATLEQGWTDAENTAALLAQHTDRVLRIAAITAERVEALIDRHGLEELGERRQPLLAALVAGTPEVSKLWIMDAEGHVAASSEGTLLLGQDYGRRPYFAPLLDGGRDHISGMIYTRPETGWYFTWSRARRDERGALAAVVVVAISSADMSQVAGGLALGPGAMLRLSRQDGTRVMQWPLPPVGAVLPSPDPLPGPIGRREERGPDGNERLLAWSSTPGQSLVAVAAVSRDHVLAPFYGRLLRNGLLFGAAIAIAGLLARAALRAARREAAALSSAEERGSALAFALAEREDLLASVQEGEARLRLAEQAGGIGLWDWDLRDGRLTLIGDVFLAWGLRIRRRVSTRAALRAVHPEDRPALAEALAAAVRGDAPLDIEFRLAPRRGPAGGEAADPRWIGVRAEVRRAIDGEARRLLGIALDVTARRRQALALTEANAMLERRVAERTRALADANARLREGEARFRGIFDATFQFIGLLSPDGTVLETNDALLRLVGAEAASMTGRKSWEAPWWPEEEKEAVRAAIRQAAEGGFVRREARMRAADGTLITVDFSIKPVRDEDGIVSLLVPEARDVTDLKVAQAQLLEAQKMETLGRLTGGVAHDFNNLLMAVMGNLALARKRLGEAPPPAVIRHLDAATLGAERGAQLTQRLLAFARRQDLKPSAVDLAALLEGLRDLIARSAGPRVTVATRVAPGLPAARVDPHALELALINLVVNARDAMPEGGRIELTVALASSPAGLPPGRYLSVAVADTGHGMDATTLARAVEPFFSTKGPGQGTGLGLSMVHGLAHQSGGALRIDSTPGEGTTCTLWLPVSATEALPATVAAEQPAPLGTGRVLLVDDEPLVLDSTAALIEELGYEVATATCAEDALAMLDAAQEPFRAVVTDFAMPGMTGAELAGRIGALHPGLPVILASGHAGPWPDGPGPLRLAKPFSLAELAMALDSALARAAA
ncbi:PAS domain-containing protein [Roseomonas stagni]|uniref:histidine kinase n=1 Tax=Falsiroseomonas algicola TaxID=2716930 RepID=A0A6M1LMB1_9PROT|nr:hybrid sensor histidine kinase/response regulator [Falsiroseomonas algicola]NGM21327.1 PAS domain-containing protein [Falsiroseomonas algicola]